MLDLNKIFKMAAEVYKGVFSVFPVFSGGSGFVCTSVVCSLFAAGYALDFSGDPGRVGESVLW